MAYLIFYFVPFVVLFMNMTYTIYKYYMDSATLY